MTLLGNVYAVKGRVIEEYSVFIPEITTPRRVSQLGLEREYPK